MIVADFVALPTLREILAKVHLRLISFAVALATVSLLISGIIVVRNYARHNLDLVASSVAHAVEPPLNFGNHAALRHGLVAAGPTTGWRASKCATALAGCWLPGSSPRQASSPAWNGRRTSCCGPARR